MGLTSQGLTPAEKATYARMEGISPKQVEELRRQVLEAHVAANPTLAAALAAGIRTKILNDPQLKKDAGIP